MGQLCLGQYSLDNQWYRAYVERVNSVASTYDVFFIDYGNKEKLTDKRVRLMDNALAAVPPQALLACLANVKVGGEGEGQHVSPRSRCQGSGVCGSLLRLPPGPATPSNQRRAPVARTNAPLAPPLPSQVPTGTADYAADARVCLSQLLGSGQPLLAHVSGRERGGPKDRHPKFTAGKLSVTLLEAGSGTNIAAELLAGGERAGGRWAIVMGPNFGVNA